MNSRRTWTAAAALALVWASEVRAQAVAFAPGVSAFPNGVVLSATPVVSYDRRYVRLGMMPQFTGLEGFMTYQVPAAVGGGPGLGPGGAGGLVGFAGMNGPIGAAQGLTAGAAQGFSPTDFEDRMGTAGPSASAAPPGPTSKPKARSSAARRTKGRSRGAQAAGRPARRAP